MELILRMLLLISLWLGALRNGTTLPFIYRWYNVTNSVSIKYCRISFARPFTVFAITICLKPLRLNFLNILCFTVMSLLAICQRNSGGFPVFKIVTVNYVQGVSEVHGSTTRTCSVHKHSEALLCKWEFLVIWILINYPVAVPVFPGSLHKILCSHISS